MHAIRPAIFAPFICAGSTAFYLPIYLVVILIYAALAYGAASHLPEPLQLISPGVGFLPIYFLFLQNMRTVPSTIFGKQFLGPLWSLAVEEKFYLAAPLLIRLLSRRNLVRLLLGSLLAAPLLRVLLFRTGHPNAMYQWTAARADALALGVLLAIAWRTAETRGWLAQNTRILGGMWLAFLAIILAIAVSGPQPQTMAMGAAGFSVLALFFGTTMLLSLLHPSSLLSRGLCNPVLREFGSISYCLYLIHDAVNPISHWLLRHGWAGINTPVELMVTLVSFGVAWGLARLSWGWFEKPLMRRGHQYTY
jgi:peptidoglycan/LPS O-acetylase OafA/YrhL